MNESYDVIVLGTGLKESILSGLLAVDGMKVLNLDKNGYYGAESASLNLTQLYEKFKPKETPSGNLGASRDYCIDIAPKFIMSAGNLTQMLLHTGVTKYLDFKEIVGSYVFRDGKVYKVPANDSEALKSSLMGLFEKRRCQKFLLYVMEYKPDDPKTHAGRDLNKMTMAELFKQYDLDAGTQEFLGHACALYLNDDYLNQPALETVMKMQLYYNSLGRYSTGKEASPYIYPLYGLGELPQAFSRRSAVYGTTYMLNAPIKSIKFNDDGTVMGVESSEEGNPIAKCKLLVSDPTYFPDKVTKIGEVVKTICILNHPIPNTNNSESAQIIVPRSQVKRKNDIYISVMSHANCVVPEGKWVAIVATTVETDNPTTECDAAIKILGPIEEKFTFVQPLFKPNDDGAQSKVFISSSYDATSHFETTVDDVLDLYKKITGKDLDLTSKPAEEGEEEAK